MGRKSLLKSKAPVPPPSLRLLVPPIRLMAAEMWQVVQRCRVIHYGKVEEFVKLVAEVFPDILCQRDMILLTLALRGRVILKLCQEDLKSAPKAIQSHIESMREYTEDLQERENSPEDPCLETVVRNFLKLVQNLTNNPNASNNFFQEVFPSLYGKKFDHALQSLMGEFLSRLEKILPVPDFKEAASFLSDSPSELELCFQTMTDPEKLKTVLLHKPATTKFDRETPFGDTILSILSHQSSVAEDLQPIISEEVPATLLANGEESATPLEQNGDVDEFVGGCEDEDDVAEPEEEEESELPVVEESEKTQIDSEHSEKAETRNECARTSAEPPKKHTKGIKKSQRDCPSCGKTCKSSAGLKRHLRLHSGAFTLSCNSCKRKFRTDAALKKHQKLHVKASLPDNSRKKSKVKGPFPCSLCGKSHSKPNPPACDQCGKRCCTIVDLDRHRKLHSEEAPATVPANGEESATPVEENGDVDELVEEFEEDDVAEPEEEEESEVVEESEKTQIDSEYSEKTETRNGSARTSALPKEHTKGIKKSQRDCPSCGKTCKSSAGLKRHLRLHSGAFKLSCNSCKRRFATDGALKKHQELHVKASLSNNSRKKVKVPIPCSLCGKSHSKPNPPACDQCGKRYCTYLGLYRHRRLHSGERPYLCNDCGKGFTSSDILKAHMRTHTGERSHICSICGKRFGQGSTLIRHMRIHTDERPFPCNTCSKSFRSKPELELHTRTHTGERPFQCSECGKRFVSSQHRRNHMRTHTKARPHACPHCDKGFGSPDQLRKHLLVHTGERPHICPECGKGFSQKNNMKIHLRKHADPLNRVSIAMRASDKRASGKRASGKRRKHK